MTGTDTTLAAAALAISLVALGTAVGQLLQQYFATADGYRRCRKSVMGGYARKTRLHWRWQEFRFETLYTTPEIFLAGEGASSRSDPIVLTGSQKSRELSLLEEEGALDGAAIKPIPDERGDISLHTRARDSEKRITAPPTTFRGELACWIPLLHWMHESSLACLENEKLNRDDPVDYTPAKIRLPAIVFREWSWDFQPPDVVRPLAKTTLSDIAVIARRMGMRWKEFRPSDGILLAEGHSHTLTSTVVRSLGVVLQYSHTGQNERLRKAEVNLRKRLVTGSLFPEQEEIYIPRAAADRLGCGVLRSESLLGLPDLTVSTQNEIIKALSFLDRTGKSSATLTKILKDNPEFRFRVADLVALTTPPARYHGSSLVQVPAPSDNVFGVTTSSIGRRAFRQCLEEYIVVHKYDTGKHTHRALEICHDIGRKYAAWNHTDEYSTQDEQWIVTRDTKYLDTALDHLNSLTELLHSWEQSHSFRYINMIGTHIRVAMFSEGGETSMLRAFGTDYKADVDGYFRVLPKVVEEMQKTGFHDRQMIVDAWVTMMLRAMLWGACHFFVPGERVPIQYFGSQLPVYIG